MRRAAVIALLLAACESPSRVIAPPATAPSAVAIQTPPLVPYGPFGVYTRLPNVDPFPNAPEKSGWGSTLGPDNRPVHLIVLSASPDELSSEALARRNAPAAVLPPGARLLFEAGKPYNRKPAQWTLSSLAVAAKPILVASDVATCQVVELPNVVLDFGGGDGDIAETWPYLHIVWTPAATATLQGLVASAPKTLIDAAFGDDVLDDWYPGIGRLGVGVAELRVPAPNSAIARKHLQRMTNLPCAPAAKSGAP